MKKQIKQLKNEIKKLNQILADTEKIIVSDFHNIKLSEIKKIKPKIHTLCKKISKKERKLMKYEISIEKKESIK